MNSQSQARKQAKIRPRKTRRGSSPLLWLIPSQAIAAFTAYGIAAGDQALRALLLGGMLSAMLIPLLVSLEAGLAAMIIFEPFRGLLRRAQYIFVPYSQNEPIHILTPIVTILAFLLVLFRHKLETFRLTPLAGLVSVLAAICMAQVFNPLQGGLFVGFTGALFYLVPMAWFYFGQAANAEFVPKILRFIVVLGIVSSLYGVYQMVVGYPAFELYWIANTDLYGSMAVYNVQRALATFSNAEEWGRYLQIGGVIALGFAMSRSEGNKRILWFGSAAFLIAMLALTGQRTSIFGLLLAMLILFLTGAKTFQAAIARLMLAFTPLILIVALAKPMSDDDGYSLDEDDKVGAMLTHTTKGTINPTGEGSLGVRLETWMEILTVQIPSNPIGTGLGTHTLAASRTHIENDRAIDNHILTLAVSAGVPAALLFIVILFRAVVLSFRGWRASEPDSGEAILWRIMLALSATFILNNFFGTSFTIYSVAPIGWLVIGWISVSYAEITSREEIDRAVEWIK
jgi:hypothetical protein